MYLKRRVAQFLFLFLILSSLSKEPVAQIINGYILEEFTLDPIPAAVVLLMTPDSTIVQHQTTDGNGYYNIKVRKPGTFLLGITKMDYSQNFAGPFNLSTVDTLKLELRVLSTPVTMEAIVVEGEKIFQKLEDEGFYDRQRRSNSGTFLTREDIYKFGSINASGVLRTINGITVSPDGRFLNERNGNCSMSISIDNISISNSWDMPLNVILPSLDDVIGIEVHKGRPYVNRIRNSDCGVIKIWTNRL